jgi:uncharacterized GH25 family protein
MKHVMPAAMLVVALSASPYAQSIITGRIVADDSGEPVPNARVALNLANSRERVVLLSDRDGRFSLPAPEGRHNIVATKTRFARGQVTTVAGGAPVEIRLRRGAAISGRVIDDLGDPVIATRVTVEGISSGTSAGTTLTDDRGEYRVGGLPAGTFRVAVMTVGPMQFRPITTRDAARSAGGLSLRGFSEPTFATTYYPNSASPGEAQSLELNWGDEHAGVDLVLQGPRAGLQPYDVGRPGPLIPVPQRPQATRPLPSTGVIRGRVTGSNGLPVPYAAVRLDVPGRPQLVRTLLDGRFEFRDLPAGTHRVSASKVGYFEREIQVPLKQAETLDDVQCALDAFNVIAGHVFDEHGDPVQGARMEVLQLRYEGGRRRLVPARSLGGATDDHGAYRLFGLRPGQYVVSAEVGGVSATADLPGYARTLFPGTVMPGQALAVAVGQVVEATGVDFGLVRAETATISGRMVTAAGAPAGGTLQLLPSQHSLSAMGGPADARIYPDGRFEFAGVAPGDYVVQAYRGRRNSSTEGEFGAARVTVTDGDVKGVVVRTSAGSSIHGRITFEPSLGTNLPNPWDVALSPILVDFDLSPQNNFASADIRPNSTFTIEGINGPRRLEVITTPPGWVLKEIRAGGIDVTDQVLPFGTADESLRDVEVIFTDRVTELIGSVRDDRARPMVAASVIVFSTDRARWYSRSRYVQRARTEADGSFSIAGLPAGHYYAMPVRDVPADGDEAWQEPAFLEALIPAALNVLVGDGGRSSVNFRLSGR